MGCCFILNLFRSSNLIEDVLVGSNSSVADNTIITKSVLGENVKIGKNVVIEESFIFSNTSIEDNCLVTHSVIGANCILRNGSKVTGASIVGKGVHIPKGKIIKDCLVQSLKPQNSKAGDKIGDKAYVLKFANDGDNSDSEDEALTKQFSRLHIPCDFEESDPESIETSESDDELSYTTSPVPDDTNMFLTEVIDSLARGFEDKLQCENLILEINSSRYAYNVTVKEVNFNVIKAILMLPFQLSVGQPYLPSLRPLLVYFSPILQNYLRNESAMNDCLQAIEDVSNSGQELNECIAAILNWFYDKDHLSEDAILGWVSSMDKNKKLYTKVLPFANWLQQAEEASSSEED